MDLALIEIRKKTTEKGLCKVIAKEGVGGNLIDAWLVEEFAKRASYNLKKDSDNPDERWWYM